MTLQIGPGVPQTANGPFSITGALTVGGTAATGALTVTGTAATGALAVGGAITTSGGAANGQLLGLQVLTELTTIAAAASTDTAIQMPAGSIVLAVSVRVTTIIPANAATFTVGDAGLATRFSTAAVTVAANSTDPGTKAGAFYNASAAAIRLTMNAAPLSNTGRVRVTIHYLLCTPPTS